MGGGVKKKIQWGQIKESSAPSPVQGRAWLLQSPPLSVASNGRGSPTPSGSAAANGREQGVVLRGGRDLAAAPPFWGAWSGGQPPWWALLGVATPPQNSHSSLHWLQAELCLLWGRGLPRAPPRGRSPTWPHPLSSAVPPCSGYKPGRALPARRGCGLPRATPLMGGMTRTPPCGRGPAWPHPLSSAVMPCSGYKPGGALPARPGGGGSGLPRTTPPRGRGHSTPTPPGHTPSTHQLCGHKARRKAGWEGVWWGGVWPAAGHTPPRGRGPRPAPPSLRATASHCDGS